MPRTLAKELKSRRGFTYVELSVVVLVIALAAAVVVPKVQAFLVGESYRASVERLAGLGRFVSGKAIDSNQQVALTFDGPSSSLLLSIGDPNSDNADQLSLELPTGYEPTRFVSGREEASPNDWQLNFFPDGTCDGGGIEFVEGSQTVSLRFDAQDSRSLLVADPLPQPDQERWPAGEYEKRA